MSTLSVRLPDETADRLKALARHRGISVNKLIAELSTQAVAAWETETRFRAMAARADRDTALAVLDRTDRES